MPYWDAESGNYLVDVQVKGFGRFKLSTGTSRKKEAQYCEDMVKTLASKARHDILRGIKAGHYHILEAAEANRSNELDELVGRSVTADPGPELAAYAKSFPQAQQEEGMHAHAMARCFRRFLKLYEPKTISDLPAALRAYRLDCTPLTPAQQALMTEEQIATWERKRLGTEHTFNKMRSYLSSFFHKALKPDTKEVIYGKDHVLWRRIRAIDPLEKPEERIGPSLSFQDIVTIAERTGQPRMVWTLTLTGMRPWTEYGRGRYEDLGDGSLFINGTKTKNGAKRVIPLVLPVVLPATMRGPAFKRHLVKAEPEFTLVAYDFRHTFGVWLEKAGVIESHRDIYMAHTTASKGKAAPTMTQRYNRVQLPPEEIAEDRALLLAWLEKVGGDQWPPALPPAVIRRRGRGRGHAEK